MKENILNTNIGIEEESRLEVLESREIERSRLLVSCVSKVSVFGRDNNDEFSITREDGSKQGIFKTWAVPIIPFIEEEELDKLAEVLSSIPRNGSLIDVLPNNLYQTLEKWSENLSASPVKLWETLERFRAEAQVSDRRLTEIFSEIPLSEDPHQRISQLFARMHIAFGYAAPFYHIEAMVGDGNNTPLNPARLNEENGGGGALDVVALALPSALASGVKAEKLNWNGLNWDEVDLITDQLPEQEKLLVLKIAGLLDVSPQDVVFAANVLEFIPPSVGGKKGDLTSEDAIQLIETTLGNRPDTKGAVVRDMNALIRFMNWFPLIHSQDNFDKGTLWSYAAVCDTASQLLEEVKKQDGIFVDGFDQIFKEMLSDQLSNLDATSAKGRFLLSLLEEGKFSENIVEMYSREMEKLTEIVGFQIASKKQTEAITDVLTHMPRAIVGGKAAGLAEAAMAISPENFVTGKVVTSEWVKDWITSDTNILAAIQLLNNQTDSHVKQFWGKEIQKMIQRLPVPTDLVKRLTSKIYDGARICVRSSSFDEDTQVNGSAAGIYNSEIGIEKHQIACAIQTVVSSFFSEDAIAYRELHGLADNPSFALLVTPFHEGPGGVLFSHGDRQNVDIEVGASPQEIVSTNVKTNQQTNHQISPENMQKLTEIAITLEQIKGGSVDIEFVEEDGTLIILQARGLRKADPNKNHSEVDTHEDTTDIAVNSLGELEEIEVRNDEALRLHLGNNINIDKFQGDLFRWLIKSKGKVHEIVLDREIPTTSHFANICLQLGIGITKVS